MKLLNLVGTIFRNSVVREEGFIDQPEDLIPQRFLTLMFDTMGVGDGLVHTVCKLKPPNHRFQEMKMICNQFPISLFLILML